jgi:hypothetical protein
MVFVFLAVRTGLEPATSGVTGRYSNQLNYRTIILCDAKIIKFSLSGIIEIKITGTLLC